MPQIAQQDYLVVEIQNPESLTSEEMSRLRQLHRRGVLLDAIIKINAALYRVVSDELYEPDATGYVTIVGNGVVTSMSLDTA